MWGYLPLQEAQQFVRIHTLDDPVHPPRSASVAHCVLLSAQYAGALFAGSEGVAYVGGLYAGGLYS